MSQSILEGMCDCMYLISPRVAAKVEPGQHFLLDDPVFFALVFLLCQCSGVIETD